MQQDPPPLPEGWTEHKAPSGHTYYHNKSTGKSTYTRPELLPTPEPAIAKVQQQAEHIPSWSAGQFAGGYQAGQFQAPPDQSRLGSRTGASNQNGHTQRSQRRPDGDRPKHKYTIPGCKGWWLVRTKYGRRFVHNAETNESFWKFPEDVMKGVVEFDRREREKRERRERGEPSDLEDENEEEEMVETRIVPAKVEEEEEDESEYEEVTDSEGEDEANGPSKRQRTDDLDAEHNEPGQTEFTEADMLWQLENMAQDQDGAYDEGDEYAYEEELPLSDEDANALFRDLLDDSKVSPFTPWDKIVEDGTLVDDDRYLALSTMKARRECFDEWSKERIQTIKEQREKQSKQDPRIPYFALLDEHASTKLYWPEFKRKYRKEAAMKDMKVSDKDKEKFYREHVKRLSMAKEDLKKDLSKLLKGLPLSVLNRDTSLDALPSQLLTNLRFISLPPKTRNPMIEAYISTRAPAPTDGAGTDDTAAEAEKKRERERREKALRERQDKVEQAKLQGQRDLKYGRQKLQEKEAELERAMRVDKSALARHLQTNDGAKDEEMKDAD